MTDDTTTVETENKFNSAFSPLAHHLFPDGSPVAGRESKINGNLYWKEHYELLLSGWPKRTDRRIFSYDEASKSLTDIHQLAVEQGLSKEELVAVATAACVTLPSNVMGSDGLFAPSVGAGSKLINGTSSSFVSLIKSLIPRRSAQINDLIPGCVVAMLLSCCSSSQSCIEIKVVVLRFLILALRSGCFHHLLEAEKNFQSGLDTLSKLYFIPFSMLQNQKTVKDAVQLLHLITLRKHVTKHRFLTLYSIYHKASTQANSNAFSSILLLIDLYTKYDPDLSSQKPNLNFRVAEFSSLFYFADDIWKKKFEYICNKEFVQQVTESDEDEKNPSKGDTKQLFYPTSTTSRIKKKSSILHFLDAYLDGDAFGITDSTSIQNHVDMNAMSCSSFMRESLRKKVLLICNWRINEDENELPKQNFMTSEVIRLRARLQYMLYDEWHINSSMDHRLNILKDLSIFAKVADGLPPEVEEFLLGKVLPSWDGEDARCTIICQDLLPVLSPPTYSFDELKSQLLSPLGKLYIGGSANIKYTIVSGLFSSLLVRWGKMKWEQPSFGRKARYHSKQNRYYKYQILKELVEWIDKLLITGIIVEENTNGEPLKSGQELVCLSVIDFYNAACSLSNESPTFVAICTPSPALLYKLLLSRDALGVEGVCGLLLKYKIILERWKELHQTKSAMGNTKENNNQEVVEGIQVPPIYGMERVALFNCFIWDFCSVLWRGSPLPSLDVDTSRQTSDPARENSILFTDISTKTLNELHAISAEFRVPMSLSITHGATFSGFASSFLEINAESKKKRKRENLPIEGLEITPDLLQGKLKVKYLDYLKEKGLVDLYAFLTTFVGSLSEREKRKKNKLADTI